MRYALAAGAVALVLFVPTLAAAQDPPAPAPPEPKIQLGAGLLLGFPHGDLGGSPDEDNLGADPSPGLRFSIAYRASPLISVGAFFRYIFVSVDNEDSVVDVTYRNYDLGGFVRFSHAVSPTLTLFGEGELFLTTFSIRVEDDFFSGSRSEDGPGVGLRAGGALAMSRSVSLVGSVGWNQGSITFESLDPEEPDVDVDGGWLQLTGELWFAF